MSIDDYKERKVDFISDYLDDFNDGNQSTTTTFVNIDNYPETRYEIENTNKQFCNSCNAQCFQISAINPDVFKCSKCGRIFDRMEKKNLIVKETLSPATTNKLTGILDPNYNKTNTFDAYEEMEKENKRRAFKEHLNQLVPSSESIPTLTRKRKLDNDDRRLIEIGLTLTDVE
jgi:DNA-directed RNA polymerase subunit M/transcription elongation factor TFIIS